MSVRMSGKKPSSSTRPAARRTGSPPGQARLVAGRLELAEVGTHEVLHVPRLDRGGHVLAPDGRGEPTTGALALDLLVVEVAEPHRGGQLRDVADEPGVAAALVVPGLAGGGPADVGGLAGAGLHDAAQGVGDGPGDVQLDVALLDLDGSTDRAVWFSTRVIRCGVTCRPSAA
jgi:hypothetical protein